MGLAIEKQILNLANQKQSDKNLESDLAAMEKNNSLFERAYRAEHVSAMHALTQKGSLGSLRFRDSHIEIQTEVSSSLKEAFPNIIGSHQNKVLEATPSEDKAANKRIAVLFSGGPAAGGHNVILGIKQYLGNGNVLFGVQNGPRGLLSGDLFEITDEAILRMQNMGGFDFLGSDRTKIKTEEQFLQVLETVNSFHLDGIIIIGGDDSNTNAAVLAEFLYHHKCGVIGVPKTIDGDLQVGELLPISFGFDTATKIYSESVGNILQDTPSSRKYWHFVKLMGRSASMVTLEVGLQTKPAVVLVSEEIAEKRLSLSEVVNRIARDVIVRAGNSINYGVVLVPEGLIEFIPEMTTLIEELNDLMPTLDAEFPKAKPSEKYQGALGYLSDVSRRVLSALPRSFAHRLLLDRDSHGNLQVSLIETESLLAEMVADAIQTFQQTPNMIKTDLGLSLENEKLGRFMSFGFKSQVHFFGYEGRCGAPSRFDAEFTYNLGIIAGALVSEGKTGYMAAVGQLDQGGRGFAIPLSSLITAERRHNKETFVIKKALVKLDSPAFKYFEKRRKVWASEDCFTSPGPRQFWGATSNQLPILVALNQGYSGLNYNFTDH